MSDLQESSATLSRSRDLKESACQEGSHEAHAGTSGATEEALVLWGYAFVQQLPSNLCKLTTLGLQNPQSELLLTYDTLWS